MSEQMTEQMTEMEAIRARHSVRKYQNKKLEPSVASRLRAMLDACNEQGELHLQLLENPGDTFGTVFARLSGLNSAPAAIACIGPDDETLEERIGYWGEKVVLFAQTLGLNTCWVGMYKKDGCPADVREGEKLVIAIATGYGKDAGRLHKSKPIEKVCPGVKDTPSWFRAGVEAALLAPTAMNQQRYTFSMGKDGKVIATAEPGPYTKVDLGIVRYHFDIASAEAKK